MIRHRGVSMTYQLGGDHLIVDFLLCRLGFKTDCENLHWAQTLSEET